MIYLATINPDGSEHHMRWEEHQSLETARIELQTMMEAAMKLYYDYGDESYKPQDAYVYEADEPLYGNKEETLDLNALQNYVQRKL